MEKTSGWPIKPGEPPLTVPKSALHWAPNLMPKTWPLCTSAELNLRDRVLGEVEKNSFIALLGKGGHRGRMPLKNCVSQPGRIW